VAVGYEVLDTDGDRLELPSTPVPPSEVVAFDDLGEGGTEPGKEDATSGPAGRLWSRGGPDPLRAKRFGLAPVIGVAAVLILVGWAVGGSLATRHAEQVRAAERSGRLALVATITGVQSVPGQQVADFTVRLVNAGPLPVTIVTSPEADQPTTTVPVVRPLGGAAVVPAGGSLVTSLRLAIDCDSTQDVGGRLRVPVRTADGVVHHVLALDDGAARSAVYGGSPCSRGVPALDTSIVGTIDHPVLRLRNSTTRPLEVALDVENSPFVAQSTNFSVLHLSPPLPQLLQPHESVDLAVTLVPWSCPHGLSVVLSSQVSPYIVLRSGYPGVEGLAQDRAGVDLSTLWGAALARNCS
jgi:hypothetical protein